MIASSKDVLLFQPKEPINLDDMAWAKERGDFYTFLAIDRRTKLIISHLTDKRDYTTTNDFVADLAERVPGIVQITCDAWAPYVPTIRAHLLGRLNLAVMQKVYGKPERPFDDTNPNHRYSQPKCTGIRLKTCVGEPDIDKICTTAQFKRQDVQPAIHKAMPRLVTQAGQSSLRGGVIRVAYNFCKRHETLGCTPALGARLTDHNWTIEELVKKLSETI